MSLPPALERALLDGIPGAATILGTQPVGGGCIHRALRLDTARGRIFCKWNGGEAGAAFGVEARGLSALREAATGCDLRIPEVYGWRDADSDGPGWLALEWLPPTPPDADFEERWGRALAGLHRPIAGSWGWEEDNRIGSLPQVNTPAATWADFWADARLGPQVRRASAAGLLSTEDRDLMEQAVEASRVLLAAPEAEGPSILHGDLWGGNVHAGPDGHPVLVDPAVYRGHREVDLAMAALFGGLGRRALDAYLEVAPLQPGHRSRQPAYQLYYLLVHLNLFGSSYLGSSQAAARSTRAAASSG